jgi:type IV secretory pathway component VirB8
MEPLTHRPPIESIDFDAIAAPLVSAREVEVAAEERAHQLRSEQLQVMVELLKETRSNAEAGVEALYVGKDSLAAAKSSARAAWIAAWVAVAGLVATTIGIIVTIAVSN